MIYSIDECRALLNSRKGEWPKLARSAKVSYSWLCKFAQGKMGNPGVRPIERLSAALRVVK